MTGAELDAAERREDGTPASWNWKRPEQVPRWLLDLAFARVVPKHPTGRGAWFLMPYPPEQEPKLCRLCLGPVVKMGRSSWCSAACSRVWELLGYGNPLTIVQARDEERCVICRVDPRPFIVPLAEIRRECRHTLLGPHGRSWVVGKEAEQLDEMVREAVLAKLPEAARYYLKGACRFEVDHIRAVVEGGANELPNLRLLCRPCHVEVTAALHWKRAQERRDAKFGSRLPFSTSEVCHAPETHAGRDAREAPPRDA